MEIPLLDTNGRSAWPDRFTPSWIDELKKKSGPSKFASQMMLEPVDLTASRLDTTRLQPYEAPLLLPCSGWLQRCLSDSTLCHLRDDLTEDVAGSKPLDRDRKLVQIDGRIDNRRDAGSHFIQRVDAILHAGAE